MTEQYIREFNFSEARYTCKCIRNDNKWDSNSKYSRGTEQLYWKDKGMDICNVDLFFSIPESGILDADKSRIWRPIYILHRYHRA